MNEASTPSIERRHFLRSAGVGLAALAGGGLASLMSCNDRPTGPSPGEQLGRTLLQPSTIAQSATLIAGPGNALIEPGVTVPTWLFNGGLPGPTLRIRRGEAVGIQFLNQIPDPTIVHWHGLTIPDEMDGHPRDTIPSGASFGYQFPIVQRAGTCWYHPHAHGRTAEQVHRGLVGFLLIEDDEEDALGLPSGAREILLVLQDREASPMAAYDYQPHGLDMVEGVLRDTAYGNGVRFPTLPVDGARYRFRVLNGSHARVYRLAFDNGMPFTVIGNDGGLLPAPVNVSSAYLSVGERLDLVVDFRDVPVGETIRLTSLPFSMAAPSAAAAPQGMSMDLLEVVRRGASQAPEAPLPGILSVVPSLESQVAGERTFRFSHHAGEPMHRINGRTFEMDRIDEQIPLGRVERWTFINDSTIPHPVHLHGTQFQIVARTGGRGMVVPYELGWKDTALLMPAELVEVLVQFTTYRGVYLLHCHNLQHEDAGMMLNVEVV